MKFTKQILKEMNNKFLETYVPLKAIIKNEIDKSKEKAFNELLKISKKNHQNKVNGGKTKTNCGRKKKIDYNTPTKLYNEKEHIERLKNEFKNKVLISDNCWDWKGYKNNRGYAIIFFNKTMMNASRASWIIHMGSIPAKLHVLHRCDNPACTNPHHLFLGTHQDNMRDAKNKGRLNVMRTRKVKNLNWIIEQERNKK